jgi:hypothetical protein
MVVHRERNNTMTMSNFRSRPGFRLLDMKTQVQNFVVKDEKFEEFLGHFEPILRNISFHPQLLETHPNFLTNMTDCVRCLQFCEECEEINFSIYCKYGSAIIIAMKGMREKQKVVLKLVFLRGEFELAPDH